MDYQLYQIALSPDLDITPEEFAVAWNEGAETRAVAYVQVSQWKGAQFIDPMLAAALLSIPASVASTAVYDLIKGVIQRLQERKGAGRQEQGHRRIHIEQTKKPDGTETVVVDIEE
jgi:hypothetical protein